MKEISKSQAGPIEKPMLSRILLLKTVLQEYRSRLDEELHPLGITTAQLRLLWAVELNPQASGAKVARLCSVTPQTGQATMAVMETNGWIRRRASEKSDRVLVSELTSNGRRVLLKAKELAEAIDRKMWKGIGERELAGLDGTLQKAITQLGKK
jgi:DNA-binding MarR family transcriptional regulator